VTDPLIGAPVRGVVLIGFGADLRGDDALGPIVGRQLAERFDGVDGVTVELCQGLTPDLAAILKAAELAVFIDCSAELGPGEFEERPIGPDADASLSMVHFLDPPALLTWTARLYGRAPRGVLLSVGGESFEISERLSPRVAAHVPRLIERAVASVDEVLAAPAAASPTGSEADA